MFGALDFFFTGVSKAGVSATYLVVAGGGGGAPSGRSGAGAGGLLTSTLSLALNTAYTVTVGAGGASATNGSNSVFNSVLCYGGGGSVLDASVGASGGSGSGGGSHFSNAGGSGTAGQGNNGGAGGTYSGAYATGGGGGAGAVGGAGSTALGAGDGGVGLASSITGSSVYYAGGGGGSADSVHGGVGGTGGGGNGGLAGSNATSGTANTGGGAGGGYTGSSIGGSGVVIISIPNTYVAVFSSGCTVTSTVSGSNNIYTVTATSTTSETVKFITPPVIGSALGGGYFAGFISTSGNGVANYYLIVAPKSSGESQSSAFGPGTPAAPGTSDIDGPANSTAMNSTTYPAAYFCKGLTIGGFSDWYSPATNELEVCYYNLKPGTHTNNTSSGINPNAVPARSSNYTSGNPAQTSATLFQASGGQDFGQVSYWTSVQDPNITNRGKNQSFYTGNQGSLYKPSFGYNYRIRAVRRVAV